MSNETTPAVERAGGAIKESVCTNWPAYISERMAVRLAHDALTAALSDGDQADALARTLWHLHRTAAGWGTTPEAFENVTSSRERENWRAVADGLRMTLTGSGS
jgi:hypothetical protein